MSEPVEQGPPAQEDRISLAEALRLLQRLRGRRITGGLKWKWSCRLMLAAAFTFATWSLFETFILHPTTNIGFSSWLFIRLYGLVYLNAFISLHIQIRGLIGEHGVLPAYFSLGNAEKAMGGDDHQSIRPEVANGIKGSLALATSFIRSISTNLFRYYQHPTLSWFFGTSNRSLMLQSWCGLLAASFLILDIGPPMLWALVCYLTYLSLRALSGPFTALQWDSLILEGGLQLVLLCPLQFTLFGSLEFSTSTSSLIAMWLLRWTVFRLMFSSGWVKIASGDVNWKNLTAMTYHYYTQPLPNYISLFIHHMPLWFHKLEVVGTFALELVSPWLFLVGGWWPSLIAALGTLHLQIIIHGTGNYGNLEIYPRVIRLTCACRLLQPVVRRTGAVALNDSHYPMWLQNALLSWPRALRAAVPSYLTAQHNTQLPAWVMLPVLGCYLLISIVPFLHLTRGGIWVPQRGPVRRLVEWAERLYGELSTWSVMNSYGLFAVMTTEREELIIEGSDDGVHWLPYEFKYKPGDPRVPTRFYFFHMPRIDWRAWFLPFGQPSRWFDMLLFRLWQGQPDVCALLKHCPFDANHRPRYMRVIRADYKFNTVRGYFRTGLWWIVNPVEEYIPAFAAVDRPAWRLLERLERERDALGGRLPPPPDFAARAAAASVRRRSRDRMQRARHRSQSPGVKS